MSSGVRPNLIIDLQQSSEHALLGRIVLRSKKQPAHQLQLGAGTSSDAEVTPCLKNQTVMTTHLLLLDGERRQREAKRLMCAQSEATQDLFTQA